MAGQLGGVAGLQVGEAAGGGSGRRGRWAAAAAAAAAATAAAGRCEMHNDCPWPSFAEVVSLSRALLSELWQTLLAASNMRRLGEREEATVIHVVTAVSETTALPLEATAMLTAAAAAAAAAASWIHSPICRSLRCVPGARASAPTCSLRRGNIVANAALLPCTLALLALLAGAEAATCSRAKQRVDVGAAEPAQAGKVALLQGCSPPDHWWLQAAPAGAEFGLRLLDATAESTAYAGCALARCALASLRCTTMQVACMS